MAFTGNVNKVILPTPKNLPTIGGLYRGASTLTMPTTLTTPDVGFKNLGFVAEDGIEENEDRPTTSIFAWGSDLVAKPQESFDLTVTFTLYEFLNAEVAKARYGDNNVTVTPADETTGEQMSIVQTSDAAGFNTWLIDSFAPGGKRFQKFFPIGQFINADSQPINHKTVLAHRMTVTFYPDTSGRYAHILTDDGVLDAS
jgi:hypothetical protein